LWYPYGYDVNGRYLIHNGIDATPPQGTPLLAPAAGTMVKAGPDSHELVRLALQLVWPTGGCTTG
jgi:murein DD-endopeptidase MepM/ murein hydrolase activator NlpD